MPKFGYLRFQSPTPFLVIRNTESSKEHINVRNPRDPFGKCNKEPCLNIQRGFLDGVS